MPRLPNKCGYCGFSIVKKTDRAWRRTPHGRPYCPSCGAIPKDWQGKYNVGRHNSSKDAGWS